jgi:hypothetical protein
MVTGFLREESFSPDSKSTIPQFQSPKVGLTLFNNEQGIPP